MGAGRPAYLGLTVVMLCALGLFALLSSNTTASEPKNSRQPQPAATCDPKVEKPREAAPLPPVDPQAPELYYLMQTGGGLSNQRAGMLQGLMMAKNLGIRKVILSEALLKLTNIQIEMNKKHRFREPYHYIRLQRGPVSPLYAGDISELFDIDLMRNVTAQLGLELVPRGYGFHERLSPIKFGAQLVIDVMPPKTWEEVLTTRVVVSASGTAPVPPGGGSSEKPRPIMVNSNMHYRLMHNIRECRHLPYCMELLRAFGPPRLVVKTFIEPILAQLGSSYVAVHYRAFACDKGAQGIARIAPMIDRLLREGKLRERPTTLYLSTSRPKEEFHLLAAAGYKVVSKQTVDSTFNVWDYPFEIMAHVDFEICRRASQFVTMTDLTTSTFAIYLELHREQDGMAPAIFSGTNCA